MRSATSGLGRIPRLFLVLSFLLLPNGVFADSAAVATSAVSSPVASASAFPSALSPAHPPPPPTPSPAVFDPLTSSYLIKLVVSLMFVLALMFAVIWLLKRAGQFTGVMGRYPMTVLAQMSVGSRERVMLIEVGDRQLLIGVSQGHIEALGWMDPPLSPQAAGVLASSGRLSFAQLLARQSINRTAPSPESKPSPPPETHPAAARDVGAA